MYVGKVYGTRSYDKGIWRDWISVLGETEAKKSRDEPIIRID